ncbi:sensor histidine kinase, partial [Rhizobium johnstonii]
QEIVLRKDGTSRLLATTDMPASVAESSALTDVPPVTAIREALDKLVFGGSRIIRVYCPVGETNIGVEVVMKDRQWRRA